MKREQKYIIVIENDTILYNGLDRRTKLRHFKSDCKDHDIIARDYGYTSKDIVEKGIIVDGKVMVLECVSSKHNLKCQNGVKGTLQYVLEWAVEMEDWKLANKIRPSSSYNSILREGD